MSKQKKYELIEAYLGGDLDEKQKKGFEKEIASDKDLANEVKLHKKIQADIGDPKKRALRGILAELRLEYSKSAIPDNVRQLQPPRNIRRILSIAASVTILGMAFWYFLLKDPAEQQQIADDGVVPKEEQVKPPEIKPEIPVDVSPSDPSNLAQNNNTEKQSPEEKTPEPKENQPQEIPSFDAYAVNPDLEQLVANIEASPFDFEMEAPLSNMQLTRQNGKVQLGVLGTLFTAEFPEEDAFVIQVFDNRPASYTNNQPVFRSKINFEKAEDEQDISFAGEERDIYYFNLRENLTIELGLYYWVIALEKGGTVVSSGKVLVNEQE
jgi:hypothetical protein